jgi:hypothetical protein
MASTSTLRSRRCRQRERDGLVPLTAWRNEDDVDNLLKHHGLAPRHGFGDDNVRRNEAWQELVDRLIDEDARQHCD